MFLLLSVFYTRHNNIFTVKGCIRIVNPMFFLYRVSLILFDYKLSVSTNNLSSPDYIPLESHSSSSNVTPYFLR